MICETDDYSPCRMEVEEASPSNRKPVSYDDDLQQTFELSTQNSTQNQIAHNDPMKISTGFEEEIENDSSDFCLSPSRQSNDIIGKLRFAIKTDKICNTFEEDHTCFNAQIFEQMSSRKTEEEKIDRSVECYNENGPALVTVATNIPHITSGNENMTQLTNSPVQKVQDLVKKAPVSVKKTSKTRVKLSVDDGKIHDFNGHPQDLTFPQAPTVARTITEIATFQAKDEDLKRLTVYRDHIPLIGKAVLKYSSKQKDFKKELTERCQRDNISIQAVQTYLKNNIKGRKQGLFTKQGKPKEQAKIANEKDVLALLGINGNRDPLAEVKYGAMLAFELFFENGFYEHWVEDQYNRIWLKKGIEEADSKRRALLVFKNDVSFSFLKYRL